MADIPGPYGHRIDTKQGRSERTSVLQGDPTRVTLTKLEKEWLGATVRRSDGFVGQVWALGRAGKRGDHGTVWVVANGEATEVLVDELSYAESVDSLPMTL